MDNYSAPNSGFSGEWSENTASYGEYGSKHYSDDLPNIPQNRKHYVEEARRLQSVRQNISKIMPRNLFRDSAWDVMLDLYIGTAQQIDIYVKQAIIASGECPATAIRIISRLEKSGFLRRKGDEGDQRRVVVSLSPAGIKAMEMFLQQLDSSVKPMGTVTHCTSCSAQ